MNILQLIEDEVDEQENEIEEIQLKLEFFSWLFIYDLK